MHKTEGDGGRKKKREREKEYVRCLDRRVGERWPIIHAVDGRNKRTPEPLIFDCDRCDDAVAGDRQVSSARARTCAYRLLKRGKFHGNFEL